MKINEIIVESRGQLDEGMMDTIKSKLSGLYQMARKKIPNFDEFFNVTKSHKSEINNIIKQLIAKKETGKVSKEDIIAAITPLSKKVAGEVSGKGVVNEKYSPLFTAPLGAAVGALFSPMMYPVLVVFKGILAMLDIYEPGFPDFDSALYTSIALGVVLFVILGEIDNSGAEAKSIADKKELERVKNLSPQQRGYEEKQKEIKKLQDEYDRLESHYKNQHKVGKMSYTQTRRMEELYNQGFR